MTDKELSHSQTSEPNSLASIMVRVEDLLSQMSLEEKIGQMTLVDKNRITADEVGRLSIGAVLSGGGGYPADNTPAGWLRMINGYQEAALKSRLGIPILYGVDAVHGHNNLYGATIFPHNVGLGASRDVDLVKRIGRATAAEMIASGANWNYAPTIAVPQDIRWGRTFEGFSEDSNLVSRLGAAYLQGLQGADLAGHFSVVGTPKHYLGDGGTSWGTPETDYPALPQLGINQPKKFMLDQGDTRLDTARLREVHLSPYIEAIEAGALTIMASFSSWNGEKLHAHRYLLTGLLKGELGFSGFIVTDWGAIEQLSEDQYQATVAAINAGIDMNMVPWEYERFIAHLRQAVECGDVPLARIDDAVRRILSVKFRAGLFEKPLVDQNKGHLIGSAKHRALAREAVAKSVVLLKNENRSLPLAKTVSSIYVAGQWANDIGLQCGGWTIEWLGKPGAITPGTTILEAIRDTVYSETTIAYDPMGKFNQLVDEARKPTIAEVGLVVLGESPYAEGFGDRADLSLSDADFALLEQMRRRCRLLIVILITGRPLIITEQLPLMDALAVAWLPGSEGQGVVDVLFGDTPFTGKLPYTWPRDMNQIPLSQARGTNPLFPIGFGLT